MQKATLGGGCFWCLDAVYRQLQGVTASACGYAGGHKEAPTYEEVCNGNTGHAEVVQVTFDTNAMTYDEVLEAFFSIHDPTTKDRQGGDVGSQYRSVIFTHDDQQAEAAQDMLAALEADDVFPRAIVTEVAPLERFWEAEAYHQDYFANNPQNGYCAAVIAPKLQKFRKRWQDRLRA